MAQRSDSLIEMVARHPGAAPAIVDGEESISYGELLGASRRVAGGLARLGVGSGDRVALWLPNIPAWLVLSLACARLGAVVVSINTRFRAVEVADIVARSGARLLVLWPGFKDIDFNAILRDIEPDALATVETLVLYSEDGGQADAATLSGFGRPIVPYGELDGCEDPYDGDAGRAAECAIFTTSGTTKKPKMVLHTQHSVADMSHIVADARGFRDDGTVTLVALPYCGMFGFALAMITLAAGKPIINMRFFDPAEAGRLIQQHCVTHTFGSDDLFDLIMRATPGERPFPSLRLCGYGAFNSALGNIAAEGDARGIPFVGIYGSSEVQALAGCQSVDEPLERRRQGGGYPTSKDIHFRVRDTESGELLPTGEAGELEIKCTSLFERYDGDEEATRSTRTDDGYFRTGDLGYLDDDGRFLFLSRIGDVLRLGGFLTNPAEIEAHVDGHPSVAECKVAAVSTKHGNLAIAFIIPTAGMAVDEDVLRQHCLDGIAKYKVPARFLEIDAFPMAESANGTKLQRGKLTAMAEEQINL
ncbi:MAG: AMP-binding protein [Alphaproteobacteria bacterium]|jgi:fatty-acyl-CoA synthase|nr:AMP-binding protein [Alphaproteobacteria bacterium]MDP6831078.1 AMP-binding protein [Alphaproteobacteria bacterium]